jgi:hypothetical protein
MIFPPRKLMKSFSDAYRQVQIPRPVSALWIAANIEYISIEYVDAEDCMVIRPIRPQPKKETKPVEEVDHTPQAHIGM